MSPPPSLVPTLIALSSPEYQRVLAWPFADAPFYVAQVRRLLTDHLPKRFHQRTSCTLWLYRDGDGAEIGFGSLDLCSEYPDLTGGLPHSYIPVLGVHPTYGGKGFGGRIVEHLIAEADTGRPPHSPVSDRLFLDVYTANARAIGLYEKFGFVALTDPGDFTDSDENGEPYLVMAKLLPPTA